MEKKKKRESLLHDAKEETLELSDNFRVGRVRRRERPGIFPVAEAEAVVDGVSWSERSQGSPTCRLASEKETYLQAW